MARTLRSLVYGLLLLCGSVAIFTEDPSDDSMNIKGLVSESVTICGDDDIWEDISSPRDARSIKSINWKKIDATMTNFIEDHAMLVEQIQLKITKLKEEIDKKKKIAELRVMTGEEIKSLVENAVGQQESFNSLEEAKATKCGKPGEKYQGKKPNKYGFEKSKEIVLNLAQEWFQNQPTVKSNVGIFVEACETHLGFEHTGNAIEDDLASFCDELCAEMALNVQSVSDSKPSPLTDVKKLERELKKAENEKTQEEITKNACANAEKHIHTFREYLKQLGDDMSMKHVLFQEAEWALHNAKDQLMGLMLALEGAKAEVSKAAQGLTELGQLESSAQEKKNQADSAVERAKADLGVADNELKSLMADLEAVRVAEKFTDEVKEKLSLMLMKMDSFAEECVREPVRNIGLSEETHVYEGSFFKKEVSDEPARGDVEASLIAFHEYCENVAKPAFELVKKINLTSICSLGEKESTMSEITDAVQLRKNTVVDAIVKVQSWLSPFKGGQVTLETEKSDYVDEGEPMGLRRVVGLLSTDKTGGSFYSNYLKKWKKNGEFLKLLAGIAGAIEGLNQKISAASKNLEKKTTEATETQNLLEAAVVALQDSTNKATGEKEQLTKTMQDVQTKVDNVKLSLEDLVRLREEAIRVWGEAREKLIATHQKATASFTEIHAAVF